MYWIMQWHTQKMSRGGFQITEKTGERSEPFQLGGGGGVSRLPPPPREFFEIWPIFDAICSE